MGHCQLLGTSYCGAPPAVGPRQQDAVQPLCDNSTSARSASALSVGMRFPESVQPPPPSEERPSDVVKLRRQTGGRGLF